MAKDRDWIDYAKLGSNLLQNVQLSGIRDKLATIASAAADEQARAQQEDRLREVVFQAEQQLLHLRNLPPERRAAGFALAREALMAFERYKISSQSFRSYEDKQRVAALIEGYKAVEMACSAGLPPRLLSDAESCASYRAEEAGLNRLIELQTRKEGLESERSKLRASENRAWLARTAVILGGLMVLSGLTLVILGVSGDHGSSVGWGLVCFFAGMVPGIIGKFSKPFQEAEKAREELKQVEAEVQRLSQTAAGLPNLPYPLGSKPTSELIQMRHERGVLMAKVFD